MQAPVPVMELDEKTLDQLKIVFEKHLKSLDDYSKDSIPRNTADYVYMWIETIEFIKAGVVNNLNDISEI
jgi:hypothetical protein